MTADGEKRMIQLLEKQCEHLIMIRNDLAWFKQREQKKVEAIGRMASGLPRLPKTGE